MTLKTQRTLLGCLATREITLPVSTSSQSYIKFIWFQFSYLSRFHDDLKVVVMGIYDCPVLKFGPVGSTRISNVYDRWPSVPRKPHKGRENTKIRPNNSHEKWKRVSDWWTCLKSQRKLRYFRHRVLNHNAIHHFLQVHDETRKKSILYLFHRVSCLMNKIKTTSEVQNETAMDVLEGWK